MAFPPGRTFIGFPYTATPTVSIGSSFDVVRYPLTRLVDGSAKRGWRSLYGAGSLTLDLGSPLPCNFFGVLGHNLDATLICRVTGGTLDRGVGVKDPTFWLDLRTLDGTPTTAQTWTFSFTDNSRPVTIGEIVIGLADTFTGTLEPNFQEEVQGWQARASLEYGGLVLSASGAISRQMELQLRLSPEERVLLDAYDAAANVTAAGRRVVVVPDTTANDLWYVEWPAYRPVTFPASLLVATTPLTLVEESMGVM